MYDCSHIERVSGVVLSDILILVSSVYEFRLWTIRLSSVLLTYGIDNMGLVRFAGISASLLFLQFIKKCVNEIYDVFCDWSPILNWSVRRL